MTSVESWTAHAGRLSYPELFYWIVWLNIAFFVSVVFSAFITFLSTKFLNASMLPVVALGAFISALLFLLTRLKKKFHRQRLDLLILSDGSILRFRNEIETLGEEKISVRNWENVGSNGLLNAMGVRFKIKGKELVIGCSHPQMTWKESVPLTHFHYILKPSDFIRLAGELHLEDEIERRT